MKSIAIGTLSQLTQVKVPTIRYYEEIGLLDPPLRTASNRRIYGEAEIQRLRFIRHARDLGFEIADIRQLIDLAADPERPCADADQIALRHLAAIDDRLARLNALRTEIARMVQCHEDGTISRCRVIEVLSDHGLCESEHARIS